MIIISEIKLDKDIIETYHKKGIRVAYGYDNPSIKRGESVAFILDTLYATTIDTIGRLLYYKHNVTLKYQGVIYHLNTIEEWKHTYQSDKDALKQVTKYHPVYQEYLDHKALYFEKRKAKTLARRYELTTLYEKVDQNEAEIESLIRAFMYLYDIDVDFTDNLSIIAAYNQIKYYLEHDIPYANEIPSIAIEDEPLFNKQMFQIPSYDDALVIESYGDEKYLEDVVYKTVENNCIVSQTML